MIAPSLGLLLDVLPLVQHDLLAAQESLAANLTVRLVIGAHELHDSLLHAQLCNLLLSKWVQGHELSQVVASNGQSHWVLALRKHFRQHLERLELLLLKLHCVLSPELCGVDEAPGELSGLQLPLIAFKIAQLLDLRRDEVCHVPNVIIELGITPFLELQLGNDLQHTLLSNVFAQGFACQEILQHRQTQSNHLLHPAGHQNALELCNNSIGLQRRGNFLVERQSPNCKDSPIQNRRRGGRGYSEDCVWHVLMLPHQFPEGVRLHQVGECLQRSQFTAESTHLLLQHCSHNTGNLSLAEVLRRVTDNC
mmetsp:Transcript_2434/g.5222  ORF Transcript_2434/g.5222 Transcript_2434/m.5222 type:complete len:308 (-) Transcript_2434:564-1487(-)